MKKLTAILWLALLTWTPATRAADIRISELPLGTASSTGTNDSFPYVDAVGSVTRRLKLSDLKNLPAMTGQYAPLSSPTFTGPVTAPSGFVGPITGNASTATALAANPTDCGANTYATSIDSHGNLTCSAVPDGALASSYLYADGSRGLSGPWSAGQTITAPSFVGPLTGNVTGNADTATALAANPTDCGANTYATAIDANGNLTCASVSDSGLAASYLKADGSRALSAPWSAGQAITATSFVGPLTGNVTGNVTGNLTGSVTGNADTATSLAANPTDCSAGNMATTIDASGNLTCAQVADSYVASGAAIARAKLASGTASQVLINDVSGVMSSEATLAKSRGGSGQDNSSLTFPSSGTIQAITPAAHGVLVSGSSATASVTGAGTAGQVLTSNGASADPTFQALSASPTFNALLNSAFDYWQRGTSITIGNGSTAYGADRWAVKNSLGTTGVITFSQTTGSVSGSKYAASINITAAPTASQANGTELYYVLENRDSLNFYGQTASMAAQVKAQGNVNQVGLQFFYATSEAMLTTAIGSEVTCAVTTGSFANCTDLAQAMGTSQTTSGVVGIRIRITGVSSGNTYDLNNGFIVEQAQMVIGSNMPSFQRQTASTAQELASLRRFYSKSYDTDVAPGSVTNIGEVMMDPTGVRPNTANWGSDTRFPVPMRATPTVQLYCPDGASGGSGNNGCVLANSTTDTTSGVFYGGKNAFLATNNSGGPAGSLNGTIEFQWTADAEIY